MGYIIKFAERLIWGTALHVSVAKDQEMAASPNCDLPWEARRHTGTDMPSIWGSRAGWYAAIAEVTPDCYVRLRNQPLYLKVLLHWLEFWLSCHHISLALSKSRFETSFESLFCNIYNIHKYCRSMRSRWLQMQHFRILCLRLLLLMRRICCPTDCTLFDPQDILHQYLAKLPSSVTRQSLLIDINGHSFVAQKFKHLHSTPKWITSSLSPNACGQMTKRLSGLITSDLPYQSASSRHGCESQQLWD